MIVIGLVLAGIPIVLFAYAYLVYPVLLRLMAKAPLASPGDACPSVTITVPAYNEGERLGATLDRLLALDYPADRRHILVVSDASTDGTDAVARAYADRGVELLRLERRAGKTAAENASARHVTGDIVVNVDATIGLEPQSLRALLAVFADSTIGVASGPTSTCSHKSKKLSANPRSANGAISNTPGVRFSRLKLPVSCQLPWK